MYERTRAGCGSPGTLRETSLGALALAQVAVGLLWASLGVSCTPQPSQAPGGGAAGTVASAGTGGASAGEPGGTSAAGKGGTGSAGEAGSASTAGEGGASGAGGTDGIAGAAGAGGKTGHVPCRSFNKQLKAKKPSDGNLVGQCCIRTDQNDAEFDISESGNNWSCP